MTKYLLILAALAVSCHSAAIADDSRADQIEACEQGIRARLAPGSYATFPKYDADPTAFARGENNAFELIETFDFAVRGVGVFGAYCAYDEAGRLAVADIEGL